MRNIDEITEFLEAEIVPRYDAFDAGHRRDHVHQVMEQSLQLAALYPQVDKAMALVAAAYHDLGLANGRENHHMDSGRILRADSRLKRWFTDVEIETMAQAAEDHRASSGHAPRSIYGCITAEADRIIDADTVFTRAIQYGLSNYPNLDREGQYRRFAHHMQEKYAEGGYLRLWIPQSGNAKRLADLRETISDPQALREAFDRIYDNLTK